MIMVSEPNVEQLITMLDKLAELVTKHYGTHDPLTATQDRELIDLALLGAELSECLSRAKRGDYGFRR